MALIDKEPTAKYGTGASPTFTAITITEDATFNGAVITGAFTTLADEDTPTVAGAYSFKTGGTTAITDFDDGVQGQTIMILAAASITITDGTPIILAGSVDYDMTVTDTLTLHMFDDQVWQEIARSVN